MFTICWRKVSKYKRPVLTLLVYIIAYLLIWFVVSPKPTVLFLSDEFRVGDKYTFLFLDSQKTPVFSDADGVNVFASRRCERCFITNNIGFLPALEYDAILVLGDEQSEAMSDTERDRRYLIETSENCIMNKFIGCEPKIKSLARTESYDLCRLCDYLQMKRKPVE